MDIGIIDVVHLGCDRFRRDEQGVDVAAFSFLAAFESLEFFIGHKCSSLVRIGVAGFEPA